MCVMPLVGVDVSPLLGPGVRWYLIGLNRMQCVVLRRPLLQKTSEHVATFRVVYHVLYSVLVTSTPNIPSKLMTISGNPQLAFV
jgi:hypothetical protein